MAHDLELDLAAACTYRSQSYSSSIPRPGRDCSVAVSGVQFVLTQAASAVGVFIANHCNSWEN